jgi:hypothetical protein
MNAPDLTQRPPRSPRVRLGGYALLPRILDKARATLAGKHGDYKFNCPLDEHFLNFTGIEAEALKAQLAADKGDGEILEWIQANARHKRSPAEIVAWSAFHDQRGPRRAARTSARGLTCWTWTTSRRSAASRERRLRHAPQIVEGKQSRGMAIAPDGPDRVATHVVHARQLKRRRGQRTVGCLVEVAHDVRLPVAPGAGAITAELFELHEGFAAVVPLDGQFVADDLDVGWAHGLRADSITPAGIAQAGTVFGRLILVRGRRAGL